MINSKVPIRSLGQLLWVSVFAVVRCVTDVISMGWCKKDVTPLLTHWIYVFLALTHRYETSPLDCRFASTHYCDVIMGTMASQITSLTIVYSTVYSDPDQRKHQSSASMAYVRGPVNSPHKRSVIRKIFPFDDVIMVFVGMCIANTTLSRALKYT